MICPACEEGVLIEPEFPEDIPEWLEPPVMQCSECGDLFSVANKVD